MTRQVAIWWTWDEVSYSTDHNLVRIKMLWRCCPPPSFHGRLKKTRPNNYSWLKLWTLQFIINELQASRLLVLWLQLEQCGSNMRGCFEHHYCCLYTKDTGKRACKFLYLSVLDARITFIWTKFLPHGNNSCGVCPLLNLLSTIGLSYHSCRIRWSPKKHRAQPVPLAIEVQELLMSCGYKLGSLDPLRGLKCKYSCMRKMEYSFVFLTLFFCK